MVSNDNHQETSLLSAEQLLRHRESSTEHPLFFCFIAFEWPTRTLGTSDKLLLAFLSLRDSYAALALSATLLSSATLILSTYRTNLLPT